ncbi:MAG: VWA domain-containing protein, partial [Thermoanaerobaculia bacterium]|nr:VWA domain-containing protein [Thermoanaerobaculia bacterium]
MARPERLAGHLLGNLVLFGRLLRREGLPIGAGEIVTLAEALRHVDLGDRDRFRDAARTVLVGRRAEVAVFERLFDRFWRTVGLAESPPHGRAPARGEPARSVLAGLTPPGATPGDGAEAAERDPALEVYSAHEVLRAKDFARLEPEEIAEVQRLMERLRFRLARRRTRRRSPHPSGRVDLRRTLRGALRHGGEPLSLARRRRTMKERPLVLLCDVSGSMEVYSRLLLRFLYAALRSTRRTEAFLFGTRLTRVTRQLRDRRIDRALKASVRRAADWGGGTRIGETLREFNYRWARRVLGQGALVLVISDGWDRGDTRLLGREMARLQRSCHRLV